MRYRLIAETTAGARIAVPVDFESIESASDCARFMIERPPFRRAVSVVTESGCPVLRWSLVDDEPCSWSPYPGQEADGIGAA